MEYYFGDLQYWKLPRIAIEALEEGFDGPALRMFAAITDPVETDLDQNRIDAAFREMGVVDAPISKDSARLFLAAQLAQEVVKGCRNVFDAATHLRIHLCELDEPPEELGELWRLAEKSRHSPTRRWPQLEKALHQAFSEFLKNHPPD